MNNHPTDADLDRDWKPNGRRPQSTIARSFSQELMDIFRIENSVADLDAKVDERKHQLFSQNTELAAIEARIKEMEGRLKNPPADAAGAPASSPRSRKPVGGAFAQDAQAPPLPEKDKSRPGTAKQSQHQGQQPLGGNLPPTPTASEDGDH